MPKKPQKGLLRRFLEYSVKKIVMLGALAAASGFAGYTYAMNRVTNEERKKISKEVEERPELVFPANLNNDRLEDLVIIYGSGRRIALVKQPNGVYKRFEIAQDEEKALFDAYQRDDKLKTNEKVRDIMYRH